MKNAAISLSSLLFVFISIPSAQATFIIATPAGSSVAAGPVDAGAAVGIAFNNLTNSDTLTIALSDLLANPVSAGQVVSGFWFTLSSAPTSVTRTAADQAARISLGSTGNVLAPEDTTDTWNLTQSGATITLMAPLPNLTLIGPGPYSSANGSLADNPAHNTFFQDTVSFSLLAGGMPPNTTITAAGF